MCTTDWTRGWRVRHVGRDSLSYDELHDGVWAGFAIGGEGLLFGPPHFVIYFESPEHWRNYPQWARGRRDEIISRIKSELRPPDYEYEGA